MPVPPLDARGLLPPGSHTAGLDEVRAWLAGHEAPTRRLELWAGLQAMLEAELRPAGLIAPLVLGGSCFSDKPLPDDIETTLDVRGRPAEFQVRALYHWHQRMKPIKETWRVDYYPTLDGNNDFTRYFQYVGEKTAADKKLDALAMRGVVRIDTW